MCNLATNASGTMLVPRCKVKINVHNDVSVGRRKSTIHTVGRGREDERKLGERERERETRERR